MALLLATFVIAKPRRPISDFKPHWLQINSKLPDGRKSFHLSDPVTIDALVRHFDDKLVWREAVSPSEKRGWSGQRFAIFFESAAPPDPNYMPVVCVHDTFCYIDGYVAESNWTEIVSILEPFLFVPNETESYEVFAAGKYRDPLIKKDLRLMEHRKGSPASGAPGVGLVLWRLGGTMHELKRPILLESDVSIFSKLPSKPSPEHRALARFVVDTGGRVGELELLEYSSLAMADAAKAFIESMRYDPGVFDGRAREWRVTRHVTFDESGELVAKTGMEYLNSIPGFIIE